GRAGGRAVRRAGRDVRQCRHFGRHGQYLRHRRIAHHRGAARQPDRSVSGGEACRAAYRRARRRGDHPDRQRRGYPIGRGIAGLFGVQGGCHQPGDGVGAAAVGIERARQRDLPRADGNGDDQADVRLCARRGQDGPRRPAEPAAPWCAARGAGEGGA
ncbi:hypothetical protein LTR94_033000, partial [Friedmanniomyces endolithicus]